MKGFYAVPHDFLVEHNKTHFFRAKNMKDAIKKAEGMNLSYAVYIVPLSVASKNVVWAGQGSN